MRLIKIYFKSIRNFFIYIISVFVDFLTFDNEIIFFKFKIQLLKLSGIQIKEKCFIDRGFRFINPKNIRIGKNCSFGHYNRLWAFNSIEIGDYVQTAIGLTIVSGSHNVCSYEPVDNQKVVIEGENWIGANVTIIGGVKIGRGSIIGAGSLVNKDIPPYSIAVGNPAKVIKKREPSEKVLSPFGYYTPFIYTNDQ